MAAYYNEPKVAHYWSTIAPRGLSGLGIPVEAIPHPAFYYEGVPPLGFSRGMGDIITDVVGLTIGLFKPSAGQLQARDATTVVNGIVPLWQNNLRMFLNNPTPANQQAAINYFLSSWQWFVTQMESLGRAGTQGVNDHSPGGKYDSWKDNYDPILHYQFQTNLPGASNVSTGEATAGSLITPSGGINMGTLLLVGAIGFGIYAMSGKA